MGNLIIWKSCCCERGYSLLSLFLFSLSPTIAKTTHYCYFRQQSIIQTWRQLNSIELVLLLVILCQEIATRSLETELFLTTNNRNGVLKIETNFHYQFYWLKVLHWAFTLQETHFPIPFHLIYKSGCLAHFVSYSSNKSHSPDIRASFRWLRYSTRILNFNSLRLGLWRRICRLVRLSVAICT